MRLGRSSVTAAFGWRLSVIITIALLSPASFAQQSQLPDFGGKGWLDNSKAVTITQSGSTVTATYDDERECDLHDGSPVQKQGKNFTNFVATLSGNQPTGQTKVCVWGKAVKGGAGLKDMPIKLTVGDDGTMLSGTWHSPVTVETNRLR